MFRLNIFICSFIWFATTSLASVNSPTVISVPRPAEIEFLTQNIAENEIGNANGDSADVQDHHSPDDLKLAAHIATFEKYLSHLGISKNSIDPDIIQETFMTTVSCTLQ